MEVVISEETRKSPYYLIGAVSAALEWEMTAEQKIIVIKKFMQEWKTVQKEGRS